MHLCLRRQPNHHVPQQPDRWFTALARTYRAVFATKIWDLTVHKILFYCNLRRASHIAEERVPVGILSDMQRDAGYYAESPEMRDEVMWHNINQQQHGAAA